MPDAQRVGRITNYQAPKGNAPARFEIVEPGKEKGLKCKAWPTTGGKDNPQPNPVIAAIESMTMADGGKDWLVGGYEKAEEYNGNRFRGFYATAITEAAPGAKSIFALDTDGNEIDGAGGASAPGTSATNGSQPASGPDLFTLAVEPVIGSMVGAKRAQFNDDDAGVIAANYHYLEGLRADLGNSSGPSSDDADDVPFDDGAPF